MSEWQPIETAPKSGEVIIWFNALFGGKVDIARWNDDRYAKKPRPYWRGNSERSYGVRAYRDGMPTHWLPLPAPPNVGGERRED